MATDNLKTIRERHTTNTVNHTTLVTLDCGHQAWVTYPVVGHRLVCIKCDQEIQDGRALREEEEKNG